MTRKLAGDEKALWARVIATVNPLQGRPAPARSDYVAARQQRSAGPVSRAGNRPESPAHEPAAGTQSRANTLDAGWDRRLGRGLVQPDLTVDLHGRSLAAAYDILDTRLEQAITSGARILLLITGKPPPTERWPVSRGAIRAAVDDWLAASRHAAHIAAVRPAHPRHGGKGALYIILRRPAARYRQKS